MIEKGIEEEKFQKKNISEQLKIKGSHPNINHLTVKSLFNRMNILYTYLRMYYIWHSVQTDPITFFRLSSTEFTIQLIDASQRSAFYFSYLFYCFVIANKRKIKIKFGKKGETRYRSSCSKYKSAEMGTSLSAIFARNTPFEVLISNHFLYCASC